MALTQRANDAWRSHVDLTQSVGLFGEDTHSHKHVKVDIESQLPCGSGQPTKRIKKYSLPAILFALGFIVLLLIFLVVY